MAYRTISVDSSVGPVGAVVSGVDLSTSLGPDVIDEIHKAWLAHHVLFFHDQSLSPAQQADFAAYFGELDVYPFMKAVDDHPNVIPIIKEPDAKLNFGGGWHTDTSYLECPPKGTMLYALEVPREGGDTEFADAHAAFEDLSPGMQATLISLTGIYSPKLVHGSGGAYRSVSAKNNLGASYEGGDDFAESEVEHPLIRTHEESGIKSIYCGKFHCHRIKGWSRAESEPLIRFLNDHLTKAKYVTRFKWQQGSVALWDNRCLFHNALNDYEGQRRHMHRVIIKGNRPA